MKVAIEVKDKKEAALMKTALEDKEVRAFVLVAGALLTLPTDRARQRVMNLVKDPLG